MSFKVVSIGTALQQKLFPENHSLQNLCPVKPPTVYPLILQPSSDLVSTTIFILNLRPLAVGERCGGGGHGGHIVVLCIVQCWFKNMAPVPLSKVYPFLITKYFYKLRFNAILVRERFQWGDNGCNLKCTQMTWGQ